MLPPVEEESTRVPVAPYLLNLILEGADLREAAAQALEDGYPRNEVYRAKLQIAEMFEE